MNGKGQIISVSTGEPAIVHAQPGDDVLALAPEWAEGQAAPDLPDAEPDADQANDIAARGRMDAFAAILGLSLALVWTGVFVFARLPAMRAGASLDQWLGWITDWSLPILLIATVWLLAMRNSRRESTRFARAANALSLESARLEERLTTVNRELSLAREFLSAQSRDLESFGRIASERLSAHADHLQALIQDNGAQVDAIASVSTKAMENMNKLRGDLPVIANSARDVTNQIGNAGRTAQGQLQELISGFNRLNEFGQASERQVQALRAQVAAALSACEGQTTRLAEIADARFAALTESSKAFRAQLDGHEVEALASIRHRADLLAQELEIARQGLEKQEAISIETLREQLRSLDTETAKVASSLRDSERSALTAWQGNIAKLESELGSLADRLGAIEQATLAAREDKLAAMRAHAEELDARLSDRVRRFHNALEQRRGLAQQEEESALARIGEKLAELDAAIAERREKQLRVSAMLTEQGDALASRLDELGAAMMSIASQGENAREGLSRSIHLLSEQLAASRDALSGTDRAVAELTDSSIRLLELIRAGTEHSQKDLPAAITIAERRLASFRQDCDTLNAMLGEAERKGQSLSDRILAAGEDGQAAIAAIDALHGRIADAGETNDAKLLELKRQLATLAEASDALAQRARDELQAAIENLAQAARDAVSGLESESADAIAAIARRAGQAGATVLESALQEHGGDAIARLDDMARNAMEKSRDAALQLRNQLAKVNELTANLEARVAQARSQAEQQVDNDFSRRVALITESLNSNAIDIAKAMSNDVTDTAWAAYLRGNRGIFVRRAVRLLDNAQSRAVLEIYEDDQDFREHVNRYIHDFEGMLRTLLSTRDGHALGVTLLSSDMGKLYVALAQAIERLRD